MHSLRIPSFSPKNVAVRSSNSGLSFQKRSMSTQYRTWALMKVAVLGAAGGIGQPISLLLKQNEVIQHLALYDIAPMKGITTDLSHICTAPKVTAHSGEAELEAALTQSQVVVLVAGVPRKPGMTRDDLFLTNATIVKNLAQACAKWCPKAQILVVANPINSTVPIVAEVFKKAGVYDKTRLYGITTLDVMRARTFVADVKNLAPKDVNVTVVGGHSGNTIVPILSQVMNAKLTPQEMENLTKRVQTAGDEVVQAKGGAGSATLSMAYAGAHFTTKVVDALNGKTGIIECAYVDSNIVGGCSFFSSPVEISILGIKDIQGFGTLTEFEKKGIETAGQVLSGEIKKGIEFGQK